MNPVVVAMDKHPELKLFTKADFLSVMSKYEEISEDALAVIDNAKEYDVLVLRVVEGSGLRVLSAKVLDEKSEEAFVQILKEGS